MGRIFFMGLVAALLGSYPAWAQELTGEGELYFETKPFETLLPANITLINPSLSLLGPNTMMFYSGDRPVFGQRPLTGIELVRWQNDFIRNNNLRNIPFDATISDPGIMAWAMANKSQANQEFYLNTVLMNQRSVGNTQLGRMNVRMRGIPYVDFTGAAKWLDFFIIDKRTPMATPSTMHLNNIR